MSENSKSKRIIVVAVPLIGLAALAVGVANWLQSRSQADEDAARDAINKLGGITVLDTDQQHVATLNLQFVKGESAITEAMALVPNLPYLQVLDASTTSLGDDHLASVATLTKLNSLHLNDTQVTDGGLPHLTPLKQLYGLHVARTDVTDEGLTQIARLPGLGHLDLSGDNVGPGLAKLVALPKLKWLLVNEVPIEPPVLEALGKLTQIKRLSIGEVESRPELVLDLNKRLPAASVD